MKIILTIVTILILLTSVSTVHAVNKYAECKDNGNIAPCIDEHGHLVYYCDDKRSEKNGTSTMCMPSPKEWAEFLPSCDSVNFKSSCSLFGPYFTCDDPEFDIRKYPYGCIGIEQKQTGDSNNNNNNGGSDSNKNSNDNSNNEDGKITVGYGDVGSYYGKGKIVIKNLDTGETLVTHDLHFGKQHDSQGDKCCVKVYPFDDSRTHTGDDISVKVTGGGGSWETAPYDYKDNLRISVSLEEIGEDVDGYPIDDNDNNNNDNDSKKDSEEEEDITKGADFVCESNCDDDNEYEQEEEPPEEEEDFEPEGNLSG